MTGNPFKYGSIVDEPYFIDRTEEIRKIRSFLGGENHLIMISPRRYGKTSLIYKVIKELNRPYIILDIQLVTNRNDFASQMLKRVYRVFPFQRMEQSLKNFRVIPALSLNPYTNEMDVSFNTGPSDIIPLEDVLNLVEKLSSEKNKMIVIFDEFQDIKRIDKELDRHLRSIMQHQKNINYVFLGSRESLIRELFKKKNSPFYHFGYLFQLGKIPHNEFRKHLEEHFSAIISDYIDLSASIMDLTKSHPYYTQLLAFVVWELLKWNGEIKDPVNTATEEIIHNHDNDYELLWNTFNRTDMKILIGMSFSEYSPLSADFSLRFNPGATSTIFSSLQRLVQNGIVVKSENTYEIDDPFFKIWIRKRRMR